MKYISLMISLTEWETAATWEVIRRGLIWDSEFAGDQLITATVTQRRRWASKIASDFLSHLPAIIIDHLSPSPDDTEDLLLGDVRSFIDYFGFGTTRVRL